MGTPERKSLLWTEVREPHWVSADLFVFDFDGTLAHRPGMWTQCLIDVLNDHDSAHGVTVEGLRPLLRDGFPWHRPEVPHPELADPEAWWSSLRPLINRAYEAVGITGRVRDELFGAVRDRYCDPSNFEMYPDTITALETVRDQGARSVVLSNHVPELPQMAEALGLGGLVDEVCSSANIGFEKPNPRAFHVALGDHAPERACMIGDNPIADRDGAQNVGMAAVLVRHERAAYDAVVAVLAKRVLNDDT